MNFLSFDESNLRLSDEPTGKARTPATLGNIKIFYYYFFLFSTFFFNLFHLDYPSSDGRVGKQ